MFSRRYGDIMAIAHRTDCRCHLCHQAVDVTTYGGVGLFGRRAATVDHLWPQSFWIDDDQDNLRIAHHGCNSHRGNRDADETRFALSGTVDEPRSAAAWNLATALAGLGGGALAGTVFATKNEAGQDAFNWRAAVGGAIASVGLITLFRAW